MHRHQRCPAQQGFTILEVLIALVVMAFGILALAGMQVMLSRNADFAKQRGEATRLAQERMERMRAYDGIGSGTIDWNNLPGAAETVTTNAAFTITPAMGGTSGDALRPVSVTVSWTDRTGAAQSVVLASVISKIDPIDIGFLTNPLPLNQPLRRVRDRNINIPIPAIELGNGRSATQFDANYAIVYSNTSGGVINICDPNQANATAAQINALLDANSCQTVTGYIVAGYVGRTTSGSTAVSDAVWNALVGINTSAITRNAAGAQAIRCQFTNALDQNSNAVIPDFKYYLCVVPLSGTAPTWGGTIRLAGVNTANNYVVCRFQYTQTDITDDERNEQPYDDVASSIDEQNYLLTASSSGNCPSTMTVTGVSTGQVHQDCRSAQATSTMCPAS